MSMVLRSGLQKLISLNARALDKPATSLHTSATLQSPRFKKYKWTPWPWPIGLKNRRNVFKRGRPGYMRIYRDDLPKPGSEEGQITGPYCRKFQAYLYEETLKLLGLFTHQCEVYAAQRIRRCVQFIAMYGGLYNRQIFGGVMLSMSATMKSPMPRSLMAFMGAAVFAMDKKSICITDSDIEKCFEDLGRWATIVKDNQADNLPDWESVAKHASCNVWQKAPVGEKSPEYRACGSFHDLPARIFYKTQLDLAYRRQWDKLVIKLEIIDKDTETGTETIQWVSQFPFPLNPREYVYQRRHKLDETRNTMVVISKACEHSKIPIKSSYVRVHSYYSAMLIRPHRSFDENGFDYVLTYIDDPQTFIPKVAVQYAAKSALPDFMTKLHDAAKVILSKQKTSARPDSDSGLDSPRTSPDVAVVTGKKALPVLDGEGKENIPVNIPTSVLNDNTVKATTASVPASADAHASVP